MRVFKNILLIVAFWLAIMSSGVSLKTPNPYKVLGISKDAKQQQIKKAFNKRSRKYHPDRNKTDPRAKQKFEKIVNAYQLLKDAERRQMYDMTGSDDPQQMNMGRGGGFPGGGFPGGGGFGMNMQDLFNMGFGGAGGQRGGGQPRGGRTFTFSFGGGRGQRFEM